MAIYHDLDNTGQEVQQRLDQVPVTQADLAEEVLARQAAVGAVQNNVDAEELRAKAAEKLNADDIDAIEDKIPSGASSSNKLATASDISSLDAAIEAIEEKIPSGASSSNKMATSSDISSLDAAIEAILLLIPSAATSLNKLADKAFVNSSIATATATFRGTKNLVSDLNLAVDATHEQIAVALSEAVSGADNNDYAFVQVPTSSGTPTEIRVTERYKFDGTAWSYEYDLNNSGFTSDQWAAINSTITSGLVDKLNALPSNADLTAALGILTNGIAAINEKIPTAATSSNKLVDTAAMQSYITQILDGIDATFNVTSTDGHVTIQVTQVNGVVTNVAVTTSDIASAADVAQLFQLYNALSQSEPEIIQPADTWPLANPSTTVIYRVIDRVNTPPQNYSDYMFSASDLTTPVLMATYNNAIDPRPKKGSQNLVTSGGVFDNMGALNVSELNATENPHTPAIYADLSAALSAITSDYQKGGMSIKFVQGSVQSNDNKYVQARCMAQTFTTDVTQWQGVDEEPIAGSDNLVKSGGVYEEVNKLGQGVAYFENSIKNYIETEDVQIAPIVLQNTYISTTEITKTNGRQLRTFRLNSGNTYKINISGQPNSALAVGYCFDFPEIGVSVSNVTVPHINTLNGTIITPVDDCFLLIGNSVSITISSCSLTVSPNGVALLSMQAKLLSMQANERIDHLDTGKIIHLYNNEDEMLIPFSEFDTGGSNINKLGFYYESAIGKPILGIKLKSFSNGTLKYGTALITNNIVGGFVENGSIEVVSGTNTYLFNVPIVLNENELIYIQGQRLYGVKTISNNKSFIDTYNNNRIISTNFSFSYCLVFDTQLNSIVDELLATLPNNLTYYALGDSITWGAYGEGWTPQNLKGLSYANYLAEMIGVEKFVNKGSSGASIYNHLDSQVNLVSSDATLITVCMGLNDITLALRDENPISIGDYVQIIKAQKVESYTNIDDYGNSILGRYRWCLEKLKSLHPSAKILAISMPHERLTTQESINVWNNIKYGECAICDYLSIPYLDFQSTSPIFTVHTDSTQPNWNDFLHDGLHPEKEGYHMMATAIYSLLKGLL